LTTTATVDTSFSLFPRYRCWHEPYFWIRAINTICLYLPSLSLASRLSCRVTLALCVEIKIMANNLFPQVDGKLPIWQIAVAVTAVFNTAQNFFTLNLTKRVYNAVPQTQPVTPLHARTFGIWTLTASVVRLYAAYNIHNKAIYDMALLTYLFAFAHFSSEILIFRTARISIPVLSPVIVATTSLVWMIAQYDFYVKA